MIEKHWINYWPFQRIKLEFIYGGFSFFFCSYKGNTHILSNKTHFIETRNSINKMWLWKELSSNWAQRQYFLFQMFCNKEVLEDNFGNWLVRIARIWYNWPRTHHGINATESADVRISIDIKIKINEGKYFVDKVLGGFWKAPLNQKNHIRSNDFDAHFVKLRVRKLMVVIAIVHMSQWFTWADKLLAPNISSWFEWQTPDWNLQRNNGIGSVFQPFFSQPKSIEIYCCRLSRRWTRMSSKAKCAWT